MLDERFEGLEELAGIRKEFRGILATFMNCERHWVDSRLLSYVLSSEYAFWIEAQWIFKQKASRIPNPKLFGENLHRLKRASFAPNPQHYKCRGNEKFSEKTFFFSPLSLPGIEKLSSIPQNKNLLIKSLIYEFSSSIWINKLNKQPLCNFYIFSPWFMCFSLLIYLECNLFKNFHFWPLQKWKTKDEFLIKRSCLWTGR